jgi:hypothetical protein
LRSWAAEDETLLSRYDLFDIRDGNNKHAVAEEAAFDEELVGPIEAPNRTASTEPRRPFGASTLKPSQRHSQ